MGETITWAAYWRTKSHPDKWTRCGEWLTLDDAIREYNYFREYEECLGIRLVEKVERYTIQMEEVINHV